MEGFSHQDRAGGLIEDPALRQVFLDRVLKSLRQDIVVTALDAHISVSETTREIIETLDDLAPR